MKTEIFEQLDEIRGSGSIDMADLRGVMRIAEELEMGELVEECKKLLSKPQWERGRDFSALLQAFGEWIKAQPTEAEDEDPNAGKGDETPEPKSGDRPGEAPIIYGKHEPMEPGEAEDGGTIIPGGDKDENPEPAEPYVVPEGEKVLDESDIVDTGTPEEVLNLHEDGSVTEEDKTPPELDKE